MDNPEMTLRQAVLETAKIDQIPEFGTPEYMNLLAVLKRENTPLHDRFIEVMREDETPEALEIPASLRPHLQRAARRETVQRVKRATMQKTTPDGRWVPNKNFIIGLVAVAVLGGFFMVMTAQNASTKKQQGGNLLGTAVGLAGKGGNDLTQDPNNALDPATSATVDVQATKPMFGASNQAPNDGSTAAPSSDPTQTPTTPPSDPTTAPIPSDPTAPNAPNVTDTSQPQFQPQTGQATQPSGYQNTASANQNAVPTYTQPRASTSTPQNTARATQTSSSTKAQTSKPSTNQPKTFPATNRVVRADIGIAPSRTFVQSNANPNATKPNQVQILPTPNTNGGILQTSNTSGPNSIAATGVNRSGGNLIQAATTKPIGVQTIATTNANGSVLQTANTSSPNAILATGVSRSGGSLSQTAPRPNAATTSYNTANINGVNSIGSQTGNAVNSVGSPSTVPRVNSSSSSKPAQTINTTGAARPSGTSTQTAANRPTATTSSSNTPRPSPVISSSPLAPSNRVTTTNSTANAGSVNTNSNGRSNGVNTNSSTIPPVRVSSISNTRPNSINPVANSRPNGLTIIPRSPTTVVFRPSDGNAPSNNVTSVRGDQSNASNPVSTNTPPPPGMTTVYQREGAGSGSPTPAAQNTSTPTTPDPFSPPQASSTPSSATPNLATPPAQTASLTPNQAPPNITVGMRIPARLITTIYTAETATTPVLVQSEQGLWLGRATLGTSKRVEVIFEKFIDQKGSEYPVQALAYDTNLTQGLACAIDLVAPTLATDLLQSSLAGLSTYLSGQLGSGTTTTTPIGGSTQTRTPPNLIDSILGTIGGIFKLPEANQTIVRVARVEKDTPLTVIYGVSLPSAPTK